MSKKQMSFVEFTLCEAISTSSFEKALSLIAKYLGQNTKYNFFSQTLGSVPNSEDLSDFETRIFSDKEEIAIRFNWSKPRANSNELTSVDVWFDGNEKSLELDKSLSLVKNLPTLVKFINGRGEYEEDDTSDPEVEELSKMI